MLIAILLASYNSEKYIGQQIDSIINQSVKEIVIYINDDGSSDATLSIINKYLATYNNIVLLKDNLSRRGVLKNFMWMLENVDADYYMFSDHDDIWLENKIELSLNEMIKFENDNPKKPVLVHTDLKVVDQNLKVINNSFWAFCSINPALMKSFDYLAVTNGITGCTMIFNQNVKKIALPLGQFATMHDAWIALCVANSGGIIGYLNQQTVLYRQHLNNVIGANEVGNTSYYLKKILSLKRIISGNYAQYKMASEIRHLSIFRYLFYKISYLLKR